MYECVNQVISRKQMKWSETWILPHLSLFVLGNEVAVEVLQGHFGHGDPLLGVVTHGGARALASHRHALSENTQRRQSEWRACLQYNIPFVDADYWKLMYIQTTATQAKHNTA